MKKYIYPILCTLLIVSQGCDHFLGNKPKGYAIPEAFEDYVKLFASQSLNSCMSTDAFYLTDAFIGRYRFCCRPGVCKPR